MEANARSIRKILHSGDQYLIPFFQRYYSWTRKHWDRLRNDVWVLAENEKTDLHFLGPMVCTAIDHVPGDVPAYQLIDGQQRLTTLTMLLSALRDVAREKQLDKFANKIHEDCLIHRNEEELQRYKVVPRIGDREALIGVIESDLKTEFNSYNLVRSWKYFRQQIRRFASKGEPKERLQRLFSVIADQLSLVVITIKAENPYEIFESLNSTGLPLAESDLIRNYLFMQIGLDQQQKFHDKNWQPFEKMFEETERHPAVEPTLFYRNYLMRQGAYSRANTTFVDFKEQHNNEGMSPSERVKELEHFAKLDLTMRRPDTCRKKAIRDALDEMELLDIATAYPLLLNLLDRESCGEINSKTLLSCFADLASFVMRRSICGESTRAYARWFVEAIKAMGDDPKNRLRSYLGKRGWPDDDSFCSALSDFALWRREPKKCRLILLKTEQSQNPKEPIDPSQLTIEHVMPQAIGNNKNGKAWKAMLGTNWKLDHDKWLHTLGNLSLTGYNSPLGNKSFEEKRVEFKKSNLSLNRSVADHDTWNAEEIRKRGEMLAKAVAKTWPRPLSDAYVPSVDDEDKAQKMAMYKQRRVNYWSDLKQLLKDLGEVEEPLSVTDGTTINFPVEVANVELFAWLVRRRSEITVGMNFKRRHGHAICAALLTERAGVEKSFGEELHWTDYGVSISRPNSRIIDEDDWFDQHDWMANKLAAFYRVLVPKVQELNEAGIGFASNKVKRDLKEREEYWSAFRDYVKENSPDLKTGKPSGDATLNIVVGWRGLRIKVGGYDDKDHVFARISGRMELLSNVMKSLIQDRDEIEQEFGVPLFRKGKMGRDIIQVIRTGTIAQEGKWDADFNWYVQTIQKLKCVLEDRIEKTCADTD